MLITLKARFKALMENAVGRQGIQYLDKKRWGHDKKQPRPQV